MLAMATKNSSTLRLSFWVLFGAGFLLSLLLFMGMVNPLNTSIAVGVTEKTQPPLPELSGLIEEARIVFSARNGKSFAMSASFKRCPFTQIVEGGKAAPASYDGADEWDTYTYMTPPPVIIVKGVMLMDGKAVAVILIGDGKEVLAEAGYVFGGGRGKIESISPDKVVVLWMGKRKVFLTAPQNH